MAAAAKDAGTLEHIALSKIVVEGNPRTVHDELLDDEMLQSVKQDGILQPILVSPNGGGKYKVIEGSRRVKAAKAAKLKQIPALVRDVDRAAALTANLQRKDLTPLEEATFMHELQQETGESARAIAKRIGKSNDYVSDRLRLVKLPDDVKTAVGSGAIGLHAVPTIARIAEAAPAAAAAIVEDLIGVDSEFTPRDLEDPTQVTIVIDDTLENPADRKLDLWKMSFLHLPNLAIGADGEAIDKVAELTTRVKRATRALRGYDDDSIRFDQDDVDAAGAFGCLFVVEQPDWQGVKREHYYCTDRAWLLDRISLKIDYLEQEAEKKGKKLDATSGGANPSKDVAAGDKDAIAAAKEQRRKEREREAKKRVTARGHNLDLGVKTAKAFKAPKLTLDNVKLLALLAVHGQEEGLGKRGLRYVDESLQEIETKKDGSQKITYPNSVDGRLLVRQAIEKAKTPEEAMGVVLRAYTCAIYATEDVVADSGRAGFGPRGMWGDGTVQALLGKIADKVVPAALKRARR